MEQYLEQLLETLENAQQHLENARRSNNIVGDPTDVLDIMVDLCDEVNVLLNDEKE